MTFGEALQALKVGKKIRRKSKQQRVYQYDGENIYNIKDVDKYGKIFTVSKDDLFSTDWEVCDTPYGFKYFK